MYISTTHQAKVEELAETIRERDQRVEVAWQVYEATHDQHSRAMYASLVALQARDREHLRNLLGMQVAP